jgi:endonuclease YncB( thermonuclease family)
LVIDGDTFHLQSGLVRHHVPLVGIDAPELGQTFGSHAKHYLLDMVESQTVRVEVRDRDQTGIIPGELFVNQILINELMLKDGDTWAIRGFRADRNLQGMEKFARVRGHGLWRDKDATSPWVYREQLFQNDKNL